MDDLALNITFEISPKKKKKTKKVTLESDSFSLVSQPPFKKKKISDETSSTEKLLEKGFTSKFKDVKFRKSLSKDSGYISSIFSKNPEIPTIEDTDINPLNEEVFTSQSFSNFSGIHPHLVANLRQNFGITTMTTVQKLSILSLLNGNDALIRSQTGSGKTLAYAIPVIQSLVNASPKLTRSDGVRALVVLPTRELALQTYESFAKLLKSFTWIVPGIIAGGERRKSEKARIRRGINVLVGTPGRLIDHTQKTKCLSFHGVRWLILDEADKLLDLGYERDINKLVEVIDSHLKEESCLKIIPKKQTVLLSATLTPGVERLAGLALVSPVSVDASNSELSDALVVPNSLSQKYVITPAKLRLVTLASFILRKCELGGGCKVLVFMATQDMVDFHTELFSTVLEKTADFLRLHGNMTQSERVDVFKTFRASTSGILLCTDVAARGLDLPKVDWIVQYTAPSTPSDYVHRVGRTARIGSDGSALLFLTPEELTFIEHLRNKRIILQEENLYHFLETLSMLEFESSNIPKSKFDTEAFATEMQLSFEQAVLQHKKLHELACQAFKSWSRFYASYPKELREVFSFKKLHLGHYAKSFALRDAPSVVGGIGKPHYLKKDKKNKKPKNLRTDLGELGRTQRLIISEFDSGLQPIRRK